MTKLEYINDTYLFESNSEIVDISENDFGKYIILDQTIFYPQGGGQPSDVGIIKNDKGEFQVNMVRFNEDKTVVFHYGEFTKGDFNIGNKVNTKIDEVKRVLNAKNHSAGHLIDIAVKKLSLEWIAKKGYHFSNGPYVEFEGNIEGEKDEIINNLNSELKKLISQNLKVIVDNSDFINRKIGFEGSDSCGCGGTHINNSSEIGEINIRKVKEKGGVIKISYEVN